MSTAAHDRIVKLVFIRIQGVQGARKTVVPLVEGCDFGQFIARVRRRLTLPEGTSIALADPASGPVDSIDRLLEIDESATLLVDSTMSRPTSPLASPVCSTPGPSPSSRGPNQRAPRSSEGGAGCSSGAAASCDTGAAEHRLDVPASEWMSSGDREDETGAMKYRKRRRDLVSIIRSQGAVCALLLVVGFIACAVHLFA